MNNEVVQLEEPQAKNVENTSIDNRRNWRQCWQENTGKQFERCSFFGCANDADAGGHLWMNGRPSNNFQYIALICKSCNGQAENHYYRDMKKNTIYLKISTHEDY